MPCALLNSGTPIQMDFWALLYVLQKLSPPLKAYNGGGGGLVRVVSNVGDGESEVHVRSSFSFSAKGEGGAQANYARPCLTQLTCPPAPTIRHVLPHHHSYPSSNPYIHNSLSDSLLIVFFIDLYCLRFYHSCRPNKRNSLRARGYLGGPPNQHMHSALHGRSILGPASEGITQSQHNTQKFFRWHMPFIPTNKSARFIGQIFCLKTAFVGSSLSRITG